MRRSGEEREEEEFGRQRTLSGRHGETRADQRSVTWREGEKKRGEEKKKVKRKGGLK